MRVQSSLFRLFHGALGAVLLAIVLRGIAGWQYNGPAALAAALLLGAGLLLGYKRLAPKADALAPLPYRRLFALAAGGYLLILLVLGNALAEVLISDMGVVYETLPEFLATGHPVENNDYYIICNNNLGLALVLYLVYALAGVVGIAPDQGLGIAVGISFNCLCIFAAAVLLAAAVRLVTGRQSAALLFLLCAALFAPFYLWAPYFYSDTLSMPFLAGAVLLYLRWHRAPRLRTAAAFGAVVLAGYAVKGSLVVLLVAALVAAAVAPPHGLGRRQLAAAALAAILGFAVPYTGYRVFQRFYLDWSNYEEIAFPTELWLCYGSHDEGDYSEADAHDCEVQPNLTIRQELMRQRLLENYRARTPIGNLDFFYRKAVRTWTDGEYGAQEYLAAPLHSNFTARFTLYGQPGFMPLLYYCQAWQYLLLLLCAVGCFFSCLGGRLLAPGGGGFMPRVALFGAMLFFSFWETKPRYALHFAPVLLFCAVLAVVQLAGLLPLTGLLPGKVKAIPTTERSEEETVTV